MRSPRPASPATPRSSLLRSAQETIDSFSASGRALFLFFSGLLVVSAVVLLYLLNSAFLVATPSRGGSLSEGIIGAPRFINPVLAVSDADNDLTALVYSGLLRATPEGNYVPDLAASYTISPDGKTYTFSIRPNAKFGDGTPVTADDVVFTITKTQDPALKSPQRADWSGVSVTELDAHTVQFSLPQAYTPFLENLTIGILPKRLWQNISDDEFPFSNLNTSPVGSGPYKVSSIARTQSGVPSSYELAANASYALGEPYLSTLNLHFYQSEDDLIDALKQGDVAGASGISPARLPELAGHNIVTSPLNRVFAVFFNQNQSEVLRDSAVRSALNDAVDRGALVSQVLGGYGTPLAGPLPPSVLGTQASTVQATTTDLVAAAQQELLSAGWQLGADGILTKTTGKGKSAQSTRLAFTLATGNVPELRAAAEYLRATWQKMGADVTVQVYDQGDLSQNVIRPRKYDALLFGEVIGREPDLFAFWDSSQRIDPGLNVALYANSAVDKILAQLRSSPSASEQQQLYQQFDAAIAKDTPAVFLYAPDFVYSIPKDIAGVDLGFIENPSDRYLSITAWHTQTDDVWPIFSKR